MRVVLDATVLVTIALSDAPDFLAEHRLLGPALLRAEALSAVHEGLWRREISPEVAKTARDRVLTSAVRFYDDRVLHRSAWEVAERFGLAKTYDASYVALAHLRKTPLLTLDRRLRRWADGYVEVLGLEDL